MKKNMIALLITVTFIFPQAAQAAQAANSRRQAEVAQRGQNVMPFSLQATRHVFTKSAQGGSQRVVVKNSADTGQTRLVRMHLRQMHQAFLNKDFSGPSRTHGANMPGLGALQTGKNGEVAIDYQDVKGGAELFYRASDPVLVAAIHTWFDAQLADHGTDAMEGHQHHRSGGARH